MSIQDFISNENVEMIWEIIIDTDLIKSKQNINVQQMRQYFIEKTKLFYDNEKNTYQNLTQMNKSFISLIVKDIQQILEKSSYRQHPPPAIVTAQDIQAERKNTFDKNLNQKQEEFMAAMSVPVPEVPKFNDKMDEPIGGNMAELISRTLAQRNFEMDQIHKNTNKSDVENWLKPAETSIKNDTSAHTQPKLENFTNVPYSGSRSAPSHPLQLQMPSQQQYQYQQPVKYIKIGENLDENVVIKNNMVDLNDSPQNGHNIEMNIHEDTMFSEYSTMRSDQSYPIDNIFAKLKPLYKPVLETEIDNITLNNLKSEMTLMNNKIDFITEQLSRLLLN